ncbi:MAG TPA: biotin/lipoyl-containing protein [Pyrinomonadaceae bacterium]
MKLTAELAGEKHKIEISREGTRVSAEIDGRRYQLEAREPEVGVYLLTFGGDIYECHVGDVAGESDVHEVGVRGDIYHVGLSDPKRLRGAAATGASASGRAEVKASMPGKVVRVLVEVGASVEAGDGLIVVEAMKMQNEMKSPKNGNVSEIHAQPGATVNAGDVLIVVE